MGVLCARPTKFMLSVTEQASGEAYTTHPSRTRGQRRQPVAGSAPKGDTKALPGLSQVGKGGAARAADGRAGDISQLFRCFE